MLQYVITHSDRFTAAELAQMAVEGGCQWIDIHLPDLDDSQLRELLVPDIVDLCRDSGVFLTVDDRPALARELGLHGVRITTATPATPATTPAALRDELGPEAVIGIETADPSAVPAMVAADIDFVCMPATFTAADRRRFIDSVRAAGAPIPIVAQGDITPANAATILAEGAAGLAVSAFITRADDPAEAVAKLLNAIRQ